MKQSPTHPQAEFEILKLVLCRAEEEGKRTWSIFFQMVLVQVILVLVLVIFGLRPSLPLGHRAAAAVVAGSVGILLCVVWTFLVRMHSFYERQWLSDAERIIESHPFLAGLITGHRSQRAHGFRRAVSGYALYVPSFFVVIWATVIALGIVVLVTPVNGRKSAWSDILPKSVSHAPHRFDGVPPGAQFLAQARNLHVHGPLGDRVVRPLHGVHYAAAGEDPAGPSRQQP